MSENHRREERHHVQVAGHYRARQGGKRDVWIKDISEYGCRFFDKFSVLDDGSNILVRVGNIGPIPAIVRWREGSVVGAQFERPLHPTVLSHIMRELDEPGRDPDR
ncbi:PilZ domain-containing protein [Qipengyuania marisflavi]|nr:PilZ domain-containing protein [Qipengyuania marisflavi]